MTNLPHLNQDLGHAHIPDPDLPNVQFPGSVRLVVKQANHHHPQGLQKSLWKGKEVARKRWLPNLVLDRGLKALLLQLLNPTRAKVGNLSWEQNQIIVQNRDHIPNPDLLLKQELQNHIHGHQVKGVQDHPQRGQGHIVNQLEKE